LPPADASLRAVFALTFFDKTRIMGVGGPGADEPAGILDIGGSVALSESTLIDVSVGAGLTSSAPDFRVLLALPYRF